MLDPAPDLPGTCMVGAEGGRLTLRADQRAAALWAQCRERPLTQPLRTVGQHGSQYLRDDVARLADHHQVARPDIFLPDLVGVVQGGRGDRRAAYEHRLQPGERRGLAPGPDRHLDVQQPGGALLGGQLVGHGPPGGPGGEPQPLLKPQVIHLYHHAIDLVIQVVSGVLHPGHMGHHLLEVGKPVEVLVDRKAERGQPGQAVAVRTQVGAADHLTQLVGPEGEIPSGGHRSVLLAQRARRCVAGVDVGPLPGRRLGGVQSFEGRPAHVDLAPHFHNGRRPVGQAVWDVPDGADVGCDVLSHPTVAPGGRLYQVAILVAQRHGQAVELQLAGPGGNRVIVEATEDPLGPGT